MTKEEQAMADTLQARGHSLERRNGEVDFFAFEDDEGMHNGPRCEDCGEAWCEHCYSEGQDVEPCEGK